MSSHEEAVRAYVQSAEENGRDLVQGDSRRSRRSADRNRRAVAKLREAPDRGQSLLLPLLEHKSLWVRRIAAVDLLRESNTAGLELLERMADDRSLPAVAQIGAKVAVDEWRKGELKAES